MNPENISDKVFLSIIDLFPVNKFIDTGSWFRFGKICWLLWYPCEYWDYFSKKSITKYNYDSNLKYYINIYNENRNKLEDAIIKEENNKLNESKQNLINKYFGAKKILKQWIEENKPTYFNDLKIVIDEFSHLIVANYFF